MKIQAKWLGVVGALAALATTANIEAQGIGKDFNPNRVLFGKAWDLPMQDAVKLVEIAPVRNDTQNDLVMIVGGRNINDYSRELRVTHWNGGQFVTDYAAKFSGLSLDTLLAGHFRATKAASNGPVTASTTPVPPPADNKGKGKPKGKDKKEKEPPVPLRQVGTTEGVYGWNGTTWQRYIASPPNVSLGIYIPESQDQLLTGSGDTAVPYEIGTEDVHPATNTDRSANGYVRLGYGAQDLPTSPKLDFAPGIRFAQASWERKPRWFVCLHRGEAVNTPDLPSTATKGDRLVVYVPKNGSRDKSFWDTKPADLEEAWRSDPLPGRVLDVRIGDPKNERQTGILVLTSENDEKDRHLYFFTPINSR